MKNTRQQTPNHNTKFNVNKHRAENRDHIDSREGEEQPAKSDDPYNRKERKREKKNSPK